VDTIEWITGKRDKTTPPKGLIFIGSGDFKKQGQHILNLLIHKTGLKEHHRILDIGCGIGRLAVPLTKFLSTQGSYEGFDIVKMGIGWCNKHITASNHNFRFLHIDLKNKLYNMGTDAKAEDFIFPYSDDEFDQIVLTSVFTHMMPKDVDNYLAQISRVMKPDGKCLATFFIINEKVKNLMQNRKTGFNFPYAYGNYYLLNKDVEEADVAFEENYLLSLLDKNNLKADSMDYGWWSGNPKIESSDFQDIVIISKKHSPQITTKL
jgi:cyclopropane fatty-acyl-phospholipid synthase-like methyltransferase